MIISASRRSDIPAFYARWFINRIRAGDCAVPNPFNPGQVSIISLAPENVDVIVFWTRSASPLMPYLHELTERGYRYYFQYTLLNNPRTLDPYTPSISRSLATFRRLADLIGPERLVWRYDPIVLSEATSVAYHLENYARLCGELRGYTHRSVISFLDIYPKIKRRLVEMERQGTKLTAIDLSDPISPSHGMNIIRLFVSELAKIARENQMEIISCAEPVDFQAYGVKAGKCIDDEFISKVFGLEVAKAKDPSQRKACGCVRSKDIGMYDSCLFGCHYCYATSSFERAKVNYLRHDPKAASIYQPDVPRNVG